MGADISQVLLGILYIMAVTYALVHGSRIAYMAGWKEGDRRRRLEDE